MAITYTNDLQTVLDALQTILNAEFKPIPIVVASKLQMDKVAKKNEYLRIWCTGDDVVSRVSGGVYRSYEVEFVWYFNVARYRDEKILDDTISERIERLERLLENNYSYNTGATWVSCAINSIQYLYELEEDIEGIENIKAGRIVANILRGSFF